MKEVTIRHWQVMALAIVFVAQPANAQPDIDLTALVECRADPREWGGLAFSLMGDPKMIEAPGWTPTQSANPFLQEFTLASPIKRVAQKCAAVLGQRHAQKNLMRVA